MVLQKPWSASYCVVVLFVLKSFVLRQSYGNRQKKNAIIFTSNGALLKGCPMSEILDDNSTLQ